jgi:hypothetical protein
MLPYILCFAAGLTMGLAGWWISHRHLASVKEQKDDHERRAEAFWEAAMASDHRAALAERWRAIVRRRHWRETQRPALP